MIIEGRARAHPWLTVFAVIWPAAVAMLIGPVGYAVSVVLGTANFGWMFWTAVCAFPWSVWPLGAVPFVSSHVDALVLSAGALLNLTLITVAGRFVLARVERRELAEPGPGPRTVR